MNLRIGRCFCRFNYGRLFGMVGYKSSAADFGIGKERKNECVSKYSNN